ncbi:hypothetical protein [Marinobacter shengliensis]|uniref:hypothetical protein n=1 Tax=Marinobacter TaxID=2742 RepID=UPI001E4671DA|nr:hypothetical protein [Marinobacter shengliensis]MCD1630552.1 hypothetical protein [Marinobacter shengliensis]
MDITKPLPELPLLERYRPLDPTTAEHDQKTGRPARYWRDMDDETFKKHVDRMFTEVTIIDAAQRRNVMAEKLHESSPFSTFQRRKSEHLFADQARWKYSYPNAA